MRTRPASAGKPCNEFGTFRKAYRPWKRMWRLHYKMLKHPDLADMRTVGHQLLEGWISA